MFYIVYFRSSQSSTGVRLTGDLTMFYIIYFRSSQSSTGVRLTGDPQADADIMAFVKARQNILQQSKSVVHTIHRFKY